MIHSVLKLHKKSRLINVDNFNFKRKIRESENVAVFCFDVDNFDFTRKIRENVAVFSLDVDNFDFTRKICQFFVGEKKL